MYPILAHWGGLTFYTYGFVTMTALFLIYSLVVKNHDPNLLNRGHLADISFLVVFSIWFGGGLFLWILAGEFSIEAFKATFNAQKLQQAGTLPISAAFALLLFGYCTWKRLPFARVIDFLMPYFILGYAIQRSFGCFSAGCCYGLPTDVAWGVHFGDTLGNGPEPGLKVHPTQLYMGVAAMLSALWMFSLRNRLREVPGAMTGLGIMTLFGGYFLVSFFRGDLKWKIVYFGYDLSQIFSFGLFVVGLLVWFVSFAYKKRSRY
ncbi:MAG: prolipoprotein diacylglyceryl transferase [Magnetococcales bacterium]|nr:prolipoprotein diacylglyceryl transferase [Magnetococcales bacterium]